MAKIQEQVKTRKLYDEASIRANSYNEDDNTIVVEFASGKPVLRYSWSKDEWYEEILEITEKAAKNFGRVNIGASVVKGHDQWNVDGVVGITKKGWIEGGKALALIQLDDSDEKFLNKVKKGILRNISFGYIVEEYTRTKKEGEIAKYRATSWETLEISFVVVPADETVGVRGEGRPDEAKRRVKDEIYNTIIRMEDENEDVEVVDVEEETPAAKGKGKRTAKPKPATVEKEEEEPSEQTEKARNNGVAYERKRQEDIRTVASRMNLDDDFVSEMINGGKTINEVRKAAIDKLAIEDPLTEVRGAHNTRLKGDEKESLRSKMAAGLVLRWSAADPAKMDSSLVKESSDFRGMKLLNIARMCLENAGIRTVNMSDDEIAKRAVASSTSDFQMLLSSVIHMVLLAPLGNMPDEWRNVAAVGTATDFRPQRNMRSWGFTGLDEVQEGAEYTNKAIPDAEGESLALKKFGNIVQLTWEMIVNDEFGAFTGTVSDLNRAHYLTVENKVFDKINENNGYGPKMADNINLFDAAHGNLMTPSALTGANLDAMRIALEETKDKGGIEFLGIKASKLVVNNGLFRQATLLNGADFDFETNGTLMMPNTSKAMFDDIVKSPRFQPGRKAYMALPDPNTYPIFKVLFYNGNQAPEVTRHDEFRQDAFSYKIRSVFGVGAVGYRGAILNLGV